jgi:hypothetical protein
MISAHLSTWSTAHWVALVSVLVLIIVLLALAWPRPAAGPDSITIRVVDGPTVLSTQVVPLCQ